MNTSAYGVEKATPIRVPATANLMLDSADITQILDASGINIITPWNFQINRSQQLINGFFSRIGVTEVVLEWCLPNISTALGNNLFEIIDSSGTHHTVDFPDGNYTVFSALNQIKVGLGFAFAGNPAYHWNVLNTVGGATTLISNDNNPVTAPPFTIVATKLSVALGLCPGIGANNGPSKYFIVDCPDLRPYRYLDFTCSQLTAVQDVKDASTNTDAQYGSKDVLVRWYFADDFGDNLDSFGFPILPGYTKFVQRRLYNPPKQIKWEQNYPVGGYLKFEVFDDQGNIVEPASQDNSNWLMTLQLSEG